MPFSGRVKSCEEISKRSVSDRIYKTYPVELLTLIVRLDTEEMDEGIQLPNIVHHRSPAHTEPRQSL